MNWKLIGKSLKNSDMRKRLLAVLGILLVYRIIAHVPIPLGEPTQFKQVLDNLFSSNNTPQFLSFLNVLSGGALANFSILLLGLGPYINASIIMQLLTKAIPKLDAMNQEGEYGRKKINQYTRILAFPLAIVQSIGSIFLVRQQAQQISGIDITAHTSPIMWVLMVSTLVGGSMLLMWLGELVTEQSVGNGISLIITAGIISSLPKTLSQITSSLFSGEHKWRILGKQVPIDQSTLWTALGLLAAISVVTWLIVKLNEAQRDITVNYAKRVQGSRAYGGVTTRLPIKLITAGVIPIIFAVAFLSLPQFIGQLMSGSARWGELGSKLITWFQTPSASTFAQPGLQPYFYPIAYFLLVVIFTYFYTSVTFNSKEIAENLQKQGGFIEGVRAGHETEKYLNKVVTRLTLFGSIALGLLALFPIGIQAFMHVNIAIGGTSILILVSVAIETLRQIESRALMVTYDQYDQPDYFYDSDTPVGAAKGARRLRFRPFRVKNEAQKS